MAPERKTDHNISKECLSRNYGVGQWEVLACVDLTLLTDLLRLQPWSQDRRNGQMITTRFVLKHFIDILHGFSCILKIFLTLTPKKQSPIEIKLPVQSKCMLVFKEKCCQNMETINSDLRKTTSSFLYGTAVRPSGVVFIFGKKQKPMVCNNSVLIVNS